MSAASLLSSTLTAETSLPSESIRPQPTPSPPTQSLMPSTSSLPLQSKMIQKLVCNFFVLFCLFVCFCFSLLGFSYSTIQLLFSLPQAAEHVSKLGRMDITNVSSLQVFYSTNFFPQLCNQCSVGLFLMFKQNPQI